jgi:hypothetical protein
MHVIENMESREQLTPLSDDDDDDDEIGDDEGEVVRAKGADQSDGTMSHRVLVIGAGAAGLAAASTLKVRSKDESAAGVSCCREGTTYKKYQCLIGKDRIADINASPIPDIYSVTSIDVALLVACAAYVVLC